MGQIAASVVLLAGAALLLRSFQRIEEQRLGFTTHGVMTAQIALPAIPLQHGGKVVGVPSPGGAGRAAATGRNGGGLQ